MKNGPLHRLLMSPLQLAAADTMLRPCIRPIPNEILENNREPCIEAELTADSFLAALREM